MLQNLKVNIFPVKKIRFWSCSAVEGVCWYSYAGISISITILILSIACVGKGMLLSVHELNSYSRNDLSLPAEILLFSGFCLTPLSVRRGWNHTSLTDVGWTHVLRVPEKLRHCYFRHLSNLCCFLKKIISKVTILKKRWYHQQKKVSVERDFRSHKKTMKKIDRVYGLMLHFLI